MQFLDLVHYELSFQRNLYRQFKKLGHIKASGTLLQTVKANGRREYYIREAGMPRERYVRKKDMAQVYRLKLKAFADFGASRTAENIRLLENLCEKYRSCNFANIEQDMEEKYRLTENAGSFNWFKARCPVAQSENPKYKSELKHTTSFGLIVRSKNECQIEE